MVQTVCSLVLICCCLKGMAQTGDSKKITKNQFLDSTARETITDELPSIGFNENERIPSSYALPSLLTANRDVLLTMAGFHFNISRFRLRGYDASAFVTEMNGIPMNNPEDGITQWGLWGGLNDVTKNSQTSLGLRAADYSFGNTGSSNAIDIRASKQRVQTQIGYTFSNRSFSHRWIFTHSSGFNKKGWAYSVSGNFRFASEGYTPGTFYEGKSYFIGIDRKINHQHLFSFSIFGAPLVTGRQSPVLEESVQLAGTGYYNAYWGYQSGKKRNANIRSANQPVMILRYDHEIDNHTVWTTSIGYISGKRSDTGLDWYKAADPRPDYYRYLPSYQTDTSLGALLKETILANKNLLQVNWHHLYEVNRNSHAAIADVDGIPGNNMLGKRAHYIVEERISALRRFAINSVYHSLVSDGISFAGGISFQLQTTHQYKKVNDLLGADFYVDWNQFAERDFPDNTIAIQNDLHRPNRLLFRGDIFGYDYRVHTLVTKSWAQVAVSRRKVDYFISGEIAYTNYCREGRVTNGLFPDNSFGRSALNEFTGYAAKAGITYKINGRKYLFLHSGYFVKAPLFDNVFISPKTSDHRQEAIRAEKIFSLESGYTWNAPAVKLRMSGYLTLFSDRMNISSFYHDAYGNFVNYALSGIDKIHFGFESGADIRLSEKLSFSVAVAAGRYYYSNRQQLTVTADNNASVIDRGLIYIKNFRVGGTPQEAYGAGIHYQAGGFYCNLSASYFRQQWLDFNPMRRTYDALQGVSPATDQWRSITAQMLLPEQYSMDLSAGSSIKVKLFSAKHRQLLLLNASIYNLLNNQQIISGGYEQLRFDAATKNIARFPPKFFYAMGLNFSFSLNLRL